MEAFMPVGGICYDTCLFNPSNATPWPIFSTRDYLSQKENWLCIELCYLNLDLTIHFFTPPVHLPTWPIYLKVRILGEPSALEKSVEEILTKIMADRKLSEGVQELSTRGL